MNQGKWDGSRIARKGLDIILEASDPPRRSEFDDCMCLIMCVEQPEAKAEISANAVELSARRAGLALNHAKATRSPGKGHTIAE
jgi:hypothetical protein